MQFFNHYVEAVRQHEKELSRTEPMMTKRSENKERMRTLDLSFSLPFRFVFTVLPFSPFYSSPSSDLQRTQSARISMQDKGSI